MNGCLWLQAAHVLLHRTTWVVPLASGCQKGLFKAYGIQIAAVEQLQDSRLGLHTVQPLSFRPAKTRCRW